uniref:Uncharacterized protein n=1 Tax=Oryza punctata TaxID=4537 RepID=A0A0E0L102_ORYPU
MPLESCKAVDHARGNDRGGGSLSAEQTWPELLGKDQDTAYDTIKRENPQVTNIVYLISHSIRREEDDEFCCNRVVLVIGTLPTGGEGISKMPQVG